VAKGRKRKAAPGDVATNRQASFRFSLLERFECGLVLTGTEVKSLRQGRASLVDAYAAVQDGEIWMFGAHIPEYTEGTWNNHTPRRARKLLLHKSEIIKLTVKLKEGGLALVPLQLYFKDGHAKVELGLGKGRKSYDKRQVLAKRDAESEMRRAAGRYAKGRR
jgi:SsrA-binding protein